MLGQILSIGRKIDSWERINNQLLYPFPGVYRGNAENTEITIGQCCDFPKDYMVKCVNTFTGHPVQLIKLIHVTDKGIDKLYKKAEYLYEFNLISPGKEMGKSCKFIFDLFNLW